MARKEAEAEAENHWPGFVDVLSTIVMVVTFLLIILGIVIFVISKNISTELAKSAQKVEDAQAELAEAQEKAAEAQDKAQEAKEKAQEMEQAQQSSASSSKSASTFKSAMSQELTQNDEIESEDKLTVRTRQTKNTKQIVISTTEKETDQRKLKVTSSVAALSLMFKGGVKITKDASGEIQTYLKSNHEIEKAQKYEIRAFFNTSTGSISEAKRLAYYRALATRNQLLTLGVEAKKIAIKVSSSGRSEDTGKVNLYLK